MINDFKSSHLTMIHGHDSQESLYDLLIESIIKFDKDVLFIDCNNSIDPYRLAKMAKVHGQRPKDILSRIHISRAFTQYQMEAITYRIDAAIHRWNISLLTISNMSSLFELEDINLFELLISHIKLLTKHSGIMTIMTIITSFENREFDELLAKNADIIFDLPVPCGQRH